LTIRRRRPRISALCAPGPVLALVGLEVRRSPKTRIRDPSERGALERARGVGKSVLLGMITRFTNPDVIVVGLIGRARPRSEGFVAQYLTSATRRAVIIATPADRPPFLRAHTA
jgi:hypothetical protein